MDQKSGKPSQKRRAILQGSLAAPVVLTVPSPSIAQMTTMGRCLAKDLAKNPPYLVDTETYDTWLRIPVPIYQLTNNADGSVISPYAFFDTAAGTLGAGAYRPVASQTTVLNLDGLQYTATQVGTRWGLKWVRESDRSVSSEIRLEPPFGYRAVTGTCWTSFTNT